VNFVNFGAVKAIFDLGDEANFSLYFPHSWSHFGEFPCKNIN